MEVDGELQRVVRAALAAHADPERAAAQQRYMRSAMPFYGVPLPVVRREVRRVVGEWPGLPAIRHLWDEASHREERYAAIAIMRLPVCRPWTRDPTTGYLDLLRHLITSAAWWDLVDEIASHRVGDLLRARPDVMAPVLREWSRDPDLWLRRTAIISQLGSKERTDLDLLAYAIEGSLQDPDFFARKAIGWALRQYARTDPEWVRAFVDTHRNRLSPLSVREALKHL